MVLGKALSAGVRALSQAFVVYVLVLVLGVKLNWSPLALLGMLATIVLQLAGQSSAGNSLCFHPLHQGIRAKRSAPMPDFFPLKLAVESQGDVQCADSVGPMDEAAYRRARRFQSQPPRNHICCKDRRLPASRFGANDRNLIFFIHIAAQLHPKSQLPVPGSDRCSADIAIVPESTDIRGRLLHVCY